MRVADYMTTRVISANPSDGLHQTFIRMRERIPPSLNTRRNEAFGLLGIFLKLFFRCEQTIAEEIDAIIGEIQNRIGSAESIHFKRLIHTYRMSIMKRP